jgi:uncharacterized membrane protein YphA (DoxX/SURF4 family)
VTVSVAAAYALCLVLVAAAAAKLRRPAATAADLERLGLRWPRALARLVPATELGAAAALLLVPSWGGVASFALLAAFSTVLVRVVRSGQQVPCACFGATSSRPVSGRTLARNGVLLVLAAVAVAA